MNKQQFLYQTLPGIFTAFILSLPITATGGELEPPANIDDPSSAMYNLEDIYNRLDTGALGQKRTNSFNQPTSGPGDSGHDLNEIMSKVPKVTPNNAAVSIDVTRGVHFWSLDPIRYGPALGNYAEGTLSVQVSNLAAGPLTLDLNGGSEILNINSNGTGSFSGTFPPASHWDVIVATQPPGQVCSVVNAQGTFTNTDITLKVMCGAPERDLNVNVAGLSGNVVLQNNGADNLNANAPGAFTFATKSETGFTYNVSILTQPANQHCHVENGSGTFINADVNTVNVVCADNPVFHDLTITTTRLTGNGLVVIKNNNATVGTVAKPGQPPITLPLSEGAHYNIAVDNSTGPAVPISTTPPSGQICTVINGQGVMGQNDIAVTVQCHFADIHKINIEVTGLNGSLVLNSYGEDLSISADGQASFNATHASGFHYKVTVGQQPVNQTCSVAKPTGIFANADINLMVSCHDNPQYDLIANVNGLSTGSVLVVSNNGDQKQTISINADGMVTISDRHAAGSNYHVRIEHQPAGETCNVANGMGIFLDADVDNINISCQIDNIYHLRGDLSGLIGEVSLQNSDSETLVLDQDSSFEFANLHGVGFHYTVTVLHNPAGQHCTVNNGDGIFTATDVNNLEVICTSDANLTLGGMVAGLGAAEMLVLENKGGEHIIVGNGPFTFTQPQGLGFDYAVNILDSLGNIACGLQNNVGSFGTGNITDIMITCQPSVTALNQLKPQISGLGTSKTLVLENNGGESLQVTTNGEAVFPSFHAPGFSYDVTVANEPNAQNCTVTDGSGTFANSDITNVMVECMDSATVLVPIKVSLDSIGAQPITLQLDGVTDTTVSEQLTLNTDGDTAFTTELPNGDRFMVDIITAPTDVACSIESGGGTSTIDDTDPPEVKITCKAPAKQIEVCAGPLCGIIPDQGAKVTCPVDKPNALNHVDNTSDGTKTVTKKCASDVECNTKWWHETSDKSDCVDFKPGNIYSYHLSCYYCCTEDGCNADIVPPRKTLFIGHD